MMETEAMPRRAGAVVFAVLLTAGVIGGAATSADAGLSGHKVRFEATSPDADTVCVNYYETRKDGSAKNVADIGTNELEAVPWKVTVPTGTKVGRWGMAAWATDDCASTDDPKGTVTCRIRVDGRVKARETATDQIAFCFAPRPT